jgi:hypothetical protein
MKNLIILSVLLLIAVSSYAQSISGELNSEYAKAMPPAPSAFSAADNKVIDNTVLQNTVTGITADDNTAGVTKADAEVEQASSFKPLPASSNDILVRVDQGGGINNTDINTGTWKPVDNNSLEGILVPAVPANDINHSFENVPKKEESAVPEKAQKAL